MKRLFNMATTTAIVLVAAPAAHGLPVQTFAAKSSSKKVGAAAYLTLAGTIRMADGSKPPPVVDLKITSPSGPTIDPGVSSACDLAAAEADACGSKAVIATGSAVVRVDFGGLGELSVSGIKVYKSTGCGAALCALIRATEPQTGVSATIPVSVSKAGKRYVISLQPTLPEILGITPVVTSLSFKIGKISGKRSLYRNPASCPKRGWVSTVETTFATGESTRVESGAQKCSKEAT